MRTMSVSLTAQEYESLSSPSKSQLLQTPIILSLHLYNLPAASANSVRVLTGLLLTINC